MFSDGVSLFFFFNDTATTEIYTLSLHDALPIFFLLRRDMSAERPALRLKAVPSATNRRRHPKSRVWRSSPDRKSTRLNSSHDQISYAVFCLKKKKSYSITSSFLRLSTPITLATS